MENQKKFIKWLIDSSDLTRMNATLLTWPRDWGLELSDFKVTMQTGGQEFTGRGTAPTEEEAFSKAAAEAIERWILHNSKFWNSNGIAVHLDIERARSSAICELYERDGFFSHWLTGEPFFLIPDEVIAAKDLSKFRDAGIDVSIRGMIAPTGFYSFICAAFGRNAKPNRFGVAIGLGTNSDMTVALDSAYYECVRNAVTFATKERTSLTVEQFLGMEAPSPADHDALARDLEAAEVMKPYFLKSIPLKLYSEGVDIFEETLSMPKALEGCPLKAVRTSAPSLQAPWFGRTMPIVVNLERLRKNFGKEYSFQDTVSDPHLFG